VYIDLTETLEGIIDDSTPFMQARGDVSVEAKVPASSNPRIGFRLRSGPDGVMGQVVGVHNKCERHIANSEAQSVSFVPPQAGKFSCIRYSLNLDSTKTLPFDLKASYSQTTSVTITT
jgi:hypothetical protein